MKETKSKKGKEKERSIQIDEEEEDDDVVDVECPECGTAMPESAMKCPGCGVEFDEDDKSMEGDESAPTPAEKATVDELFQGLEEVRGKPDESPEQYAERMRMKRLIKALNAYSNVVQHPWPRQIAKLWDTFPEYRNDPEELYTLLIEKIKVSPKDAKRICDSTFWDKLHPTEVASPGIIGESPYKNAPTQAAAPAQEQPRNTYRPYRPAPVQAAQQPVQAGTYTEEQVSELMERAQEEIRANMDSEIEEKALAIVDRRMREEEERRRRREAEETERKRKDAEIAEIKAQASRTEELLQKIAKGEIGQPPKPVTNEPTEREKSMQKALEEAQQQIENLREDKTKAEIEKMIAESKKEVLTLLEERLREFKSEIPGFVKQNIGSGLDGILSDDVRLELAKITNRKDVLSQASPILKDVILALIQPPKTQAAAMTEGGSSFMTEDQRRALLASDAAAAAAASAANAAPAPATPAAPVQPPVVQTPGAGAMVPLAALPSTDLESASAVPTGTPNGRPTLPS